MNLVLRASARILFHPSLAVHYAMRFLGRWRDWDWIDPDILVGRRPARRDIPRLAARGITAVVNLCEEFGGHKQMLADNRIEQLHLPTVDHCCPSSNSLLAGLAFAVAQVASGGKVLMHCKVGRGRSAALAICYLMLRHRLTADKAHRAVRAARPQVIRRIPRQGPVLAVEKLIREGRLDSGGRRLARDV